MHVDMLQSSGGSTARSWYCNRTPREEKNSFSTFPACFPIDFSCGNLGGNVSNGDHMTVAYCSVLIMSNHLERDCITLGDA